MKSNFQMYSLVLVFWLGMKFNFPNVRVLFSGSYQRFGYETNVETGVETLEDSSIWKLQLKIIKLGHIV